MTLNVTLATLYINHLLHVGLPVPRLWVLVDYFYVYLFVCLLGISKRIVFAHFAVIRFRMRQRLPK